MKENIPSKVELAEIIYDINRIFPLRGTLGDRVTNVVTIWGKRIQRLKNKRNAAQAAVNDAPAPQ